MTRLEEEIETTDPKAEQAAAGGHDKSVDVWSMSVKEQKARVLEPFNDFIENDEIDEFFEYLTHVGIDVTVLRNADDMEGVILGHYRVAKGLYDIDTVFEDLACFGPIRQRIRSLRRENLLNEHKKRKAT